MSPAVAELAGAVMHLVNLVRRGQAKAFNPELIGILELLDRDGPMTPSQIAEAVPAPRSSISRRVKALAQQGWVSAETAGPDGRSYTAHITTDGQAELARLRAEGLQVFAAMVADWTDSEIHDLAAATRRLTSTAPPPTASDLRTRPWWKQSD